LELYRYTPITISYRSLMSARRQRKTWSKDYILLLCLHLRRKKIKELNIYANQGLTNPFPGVRR
jgi:hypothetical protein